MSATVCPHCHYDRSAGKIAAGAGKGAAVGIASLINPVLGAVALTGLALDAWINSGKTEVECPHCGRFYHN
jgi:hypothetical protein